MANLEPRADKVVREAVDAFMEGALVPRFVGEVVFETANSRYRLLDGTVFAAPDASLIGAELVGWLSETKRRCLIEWSWQPGSRAVLVDRKRDRNIIVTSTTRLLHKEEQAPPSFQSEPEAPDPEAEPAPVEPLPAFSARRAAIIAATPAPAAVIDAPARPGAPRPGASSPFASAAQVVVPAPTPSAARRAAAVHAPPRPIAPRAAATPLPQARPLPMPASPPRRGSPVPPAFTSAPGAQAPMMPSIPTAPGLPDASVGEFTAAPVAWELTSGEFEMETDTDEPPTEQVPQRGSPHHNAEQHGFYGPDQGGLDAEDDELEPLMSEPFPLLRPAAPSSHGSSRK